MPDLHSRRRADARRARARRRRLVGLSIFLALILACLLVALVLLTKNREDPSMGKPTPGGVTEPAPELNLPKEIKLLSPTLPASVSVDVSDFVSGLERTGITVSFVEEPVALEGEQTVSLFFSDGKAHCTRQTTCYRFAMNQSVVVDVTENRTADVRDFVTDEKVVVSLAEAVVLDSIGEKKVTLLCGEKSYSVLYIVKESNPPKGRPCDVTAEIGTLPDPVTLVEQIEDESAVTVSYKKPPILTTVGDYAVTLILTDAYGNTAEIDSIIHTIPAADAPKFTGLDDLKISVGDSVSYKKGVDAVDPQDGSVKFTVDAENVDRNQEGTYVVYYSATDSDGNTTIIPRKVIVQSLNQTKMEAYARNVLESIITEDMTRDEKIQAVYQYSRSNVQYVGSSNKENIWVSAYEGLTTGKGDCYTYYAINRVFLGMLGIENLEVRRTGGTSNHWWNLVLHEDGYYYHVDSCPVAVKDSRVFHGKMTESDLVVYTNNEGVIHRRPNFYVYDKTLPEYEDINIAP